MIRTTKRLAADILGVGVNKIRIKEEGLERAQTALTRDDVRAMIKEKLIYLEKNKKRDVPKKQRRKRTGSRKGKLYSRKGKKERWMEKIRAQRKYLAELYEKGMIDNATRRKVYMKIKGNSFRGKKALYNYLKDNKLLLKEEKA